MTAFDDIIASYFTDDEGLNARVAILIVVSILVWRSLYLLAQAPPPNPEPEPPAESRVTLPAPARSWWWPSKTEQLRAAVDLERAETDLLLSQTQNVEANKGLVQARAELSAVMTELSSTQQPARQDASLTLQEISNILALADLEPPQRSELQTLFIAAMEEKRA